MAKRRTIHTATTLQHTHLMLSQSVLPAPLEQPLASPVQQVQDPVHPAQVQVQPGQPPLNWSYFKPEFSGKPGEDAEANLVRTNDWMEPITFQM